MTTTNSQPSRSPPLPPNLPPSPVSNAGILPVGAPVTPGGSAVGSPPSGSTASSPPSGPLTAEHLKALALANQRSKKLRSAAAVAKFNGVCGGVFSAASLLFAVGGAMFGDFGWLSWIMGIGLGVISWNELRGRKLLQQLDPRAPAILGWNQLALLGLVVAYAAWMMGAGLLGANPYEEAMQQEPMTRQVLGNIGHLYKTMTVAVYGALIAGTLIFQGLNARYYFARTRILQDYLAQTPPWVVELQRCQASSR